MPDRMPRHRDGTLDTGGWGAALRFIFGQGAQQELPPAIEPIAGPRAPPDEGSYEHALRRSNIATAQLATAAQISGQVPLAVASREGVADAMRRLSGDFSHDD